MAADSMFETMYTSYGRMVEVGRLGLKPDESADERVILDVPRQDPQYDSIWLAMSPTEARDLAGLLMRHAAAAEVPASPAPMMQQA
ncbi:MAG TPA: hypothetical protein VFZ37_14580 [Jiangellaceae bacterium]